jgi:hypothetical protein
LLTAIGLKPGGGSTVHIYTQTIHRTTQLTNWEECGLCPVFASYTLAFSFQLRKKHGKTSVRVAEECQLARLKQNIQNRTYITIRIHNLTKLNKNIPNLCKYFHRKLKNMPKIKPNARNKRVPVLI